MPAKIRRRNSAEKLAHYREVLSQLAARKVSVGILGSEASKPYEKGSDVTTVQVATWNHYGTSKIPARPFIAIAMERARAKLAATIQRVAKLVLNDKLGVDVGLELLGAEAQSEIQATIAAGVSPANAARTIARKGSSTPLVDTGQLRSAVTYQVRNK